MPDVQDCSRVCLGIGLTGEFSSIAQARRPSCAPYSADTTRASGSFGTINDRRGYLLMPVVLLAPLCVNGRPLASGLPELRVVRKHERPCAKDISTNRKGTHEARTSSPPTLPVSDPLPWNGRRDPVGVRDFLNLIAPNGLASTRRRQRF
jgi:hypothetical protein